MTIILKKNATIEEIRAAEKKLQAASRKRNKKKGGLSEFFGTLKRGFDGLEYQKKVRTRTEELELTAKCLYVPRHPSLVPFLRTKVKHHLEIKPSAREIIGHGVLIVVEVLDPDIRDHIFDTEDIQYIEAHPY